MKQQPLGSKKNKDEEEHKLENLVLGGDEDLIEKLVQSDRVYTLVLKLDQTIVVFVECNISGADTSHSPFFLSILS